MNTKRLVLFDFDGTITTKDTFIEFIKFARGSLRYYAGFVFLLPVLVLYKLKLIVNWRAKEIMFSHFFKGMSESAFNELGERFALEKLPTLLKSQALEKLLEHQNNGDLILIVTASSGSWIERWSRSLGILIIDTRWQIIDNKITGKIDGRNCYGAEKAVRIGQAVDITSFESIIAYGDTRGDREMLALANEKNYRVFAE